MSPEATTVTAKKRMGRPRKPPAERHVEVMNVRATAEDADAVDRIAIRTRRSRSSVLREAIHNYVASMGDAARDLFRGGPPAAGGAAA